MSEMVQGGAGNLTSILETCQTLCIKKYFHHYQFITKKIVTKDTTKIHMNAIHNKTVGLS